MLAKILKDFTPEEIRELKKATTRQAVINIIAGVLGVAATVVVSLILTAAMRGVLPNQQIDLIIPTD